MTDENLKKELQKVLLEYQRIQHSLSMKRGIEQSKQQIIIISQNNRDINSLPNNLTQSTKS